MIRLKRKEKPTNELFSTQIKPYCDKVFDQLKGISLKQELIESLELSIQNKTKTDMEEWKCDMNFETYKNLYLTNARHMIANLTLGNEINNADLIQKVNDGLISIDQLVNMTPQEMHSERWQTLIEKRKLDVDKSTKDPEATTSLFWCSRCNRNKCTYFQRQDRSCDEAMTIHITCCHCGKKWRQ
jgi:DNA-directed RNA polymerase subunit M/transcription elongation factor TFIIS